MQIIVSLDGTITVSKKRERENKGSSRVEVLSDYTVLDIETTGLDPSFDAIIEVSASRIRKNQIEDTFTALVKPDYPIDAHRYNQRNVSGRVAHR